jgi:hypothetical protein
VIQVMYKQIVGDTDRYLWSNDIGHLACVVKCVNTRSKGGVGGLPVEDRGVIA